MRTKDTRIATAPRRPSTRVRLNNFEADTLMNSSAVRDHQPNPPESRIGRLAGSAALRGSALAEINYRATLPFFTVHITIIVIGITRIFFHI